MDRAPACSRSSPPRDRTTGGGAEQNGNKRSSTAVDERRTNDNSVQNGALDNPLLKAWTPCDQVSRLGDGSGVGDNVLAIVAVDPASGGVDV